MNESHRSPLLPPPANRSFPQQTFSYWVKRLLACNPLYLVSAACLLYGLYRLTIDPTVAGAELKQLGTIFGSLQIYEILLVVTAIFLAGREIWYDSTLLVSLENMLVFVPFILVTVAAFLGEKMAWIVCGTGAALAVIKFVGLKRMIRKLNLPVRLLLIGALLLVANLAVPFIFKARLKTDVAPLVGFSRYGWLVVLPVLFGLTNLLRRPTHWGGVAAQRSWLPLGFATIWITVTAVHLYCLGYIYDLKWTPALLAPLLWMGTWTWSNRYTDCADLLPQGWGPEIIVLPAIVLFLGAWDGNCRIIFALATLNAVLYGSLYWRQRSNRFTPHLLLISLTTLVATLPESLGQLLLHHFGRETWVLGTIVVYLIGLSLFSRNPVWTLAGAVTIALGITCRDLGFGYGFQAAFVYLMVNSLRWQTERRAEADVIRVLAVAAWLLNSTFWVFDAREPYPWITALTAAFVLGSYLSVWFLSHRWVSTVVPIATGLGLLSIPVKWLIDSATVGLIAVLAAFILFGAGTITALMKSKWQAFQKTA